jgi:NAD(P)-dependent dehydrogenase (short-subunit alcohol dehydrogenase family)
MELLFTLTENPIYELNLESADNDKIIEIYKRAKKFDNEEDYVNFCLNNIKHIDLILKFAPFDKIMNLFLNNRLLANYLTKDLIDNIINYHQIEFSLKKQKNKISLNNKFNSVYNFNTQVYQKRLDKVLPECLQKLNIILGESMIFDICNNQKFNEILENKKDYFWEIYVSQHCVLQVNKKNSDKNAFFLIKHNNLNYIIYYNYYDIDVVLNENLICGDNNNIYASPLGYHTIANDSFVPKDKKFDIKEHVISAKVSFGGIHKKNMTHFNKNMHHHCYICKKTYYKQHHFENYKFMCFECGIDNYLFEKEMVSMQNMTAFITGIRHTIGFSIALKLLRSGCLVIGTSRFPMCALYNYQQEKDYDLWKDRLVICQCDFLNMESVQKTIELVKTYKPHIIINNACQTIRPTKEYYQKVSLIEKSVSEKMYLIDDKDKNRDIAICSEDKIVNVENTLFLNKNWSYTQNFPKIETGIIIPVNFTRNICDSSLDLKHNSWTLNLQDVTMTELLEVNAINQITPTIIIQQLLEHMQEPAFVIQVSAKEGIFNCHKSTELGLHPHTNMCKAGMNMLIRTLSETKRKNQNFYAVDPGYVSGTAEKDYPLNINDGAQRVIYPIISYIKGKPLQMGHYKNYKLHVW